MAKRAVLPISMELIHHLLQLPEDVEILHSTIGNYGLTLELVITAPNMADTDTEIGAMPPRVTAHYTRDEDGRVYLSSLAYPSEKSSGGAE